MCTAVVYRYSSWYVNWTSPSQTVDLTVGHVLWFSTVGHVLWFSAENGLHDRLQDRKLGCEKSSTVLFKTNPYFFRLLDCNQIYQAFALKRSSIIIFLMLRLQTTVSWNIFISAPTPGALIQPGSKTIFL